MYLNPCLLLVELFGEQLQGVKIIYANLHYKQIMNGETWPLPVDEAKLNFKCFKTFESDIR